MPEKKIENVRKRDGRVVPYDEGRIADAIHKAAKSVGVDDRFLASDLANVVTLYLERYHGQDVPESRGIQEMVEKVLIETGHAAIARAYIHYRDETAPAAEAQPPLADDLFPSGQLFVEASTRGEATAWGRDRIAAALVTEAGLEREAAESVAAAVEAKVFRSGHRRITTATIRQLVDHELFTRGLTGKLRRQSVVGVPKYDLDRLVQAGACEGASDPARVCEAVGELALRQYALQELFSEEVAAAHVDGTIHIANLEHPLKLAWIAPSIEYLKRRGLRLSAPGLPEVPDGARALTTQLRAVAAAAPRFAADAMEIIHAETFYAPLVAGLGPREMETEAADLAAAAASGAARSAASHLTLHLHVPRALRRLRATGPNATSLEMRYEDLADTSLRLSRGLLDVLRGAPAGPRGTLAVAVAGSAFQDAARSAALREACALAAASGDVLFLLDRGDDLAWPSSRLGAFGPAGEGAHTAEETWFTVAQVVFINLPQIAYRGSPGDLEGFYDRLEGAIDLAVRAHRHKSQVLRRFYGETGAFGQQAGWAHEGRGALRLADDVYLVVPLGLNEAVRHLHGHEIGETEDALKVGVRALSCLSYWILEGANRMGLRIALGEYPPAEAPVRLARIDGRAYPAARDAGVGEQRPYTPSFHCRPGASLSLSERLAIESRFHTLFKAGCVEIPFPPDVARSAHEIFTLLQRAYAETKAAQIHIR